MAASNKKLPYLCYRIAQNSGGENEGEKVWRISNFQLLARKTLANARSCSIGWEGGGGGGW